MAKDIPFYTVTQVPEGYVIVRMDDAISTWAQSGEKDMNERFRFCEKHCYEELARRAKILKANAVLGYTESVQVDGQRVFMHVVGTPVVLQRKT